MPENDKIKEFNAFLDAPALVAAWDRKDYDAFWATAYSHDPEDMIRALTALLLREVRRQRKSIPEWIDLQTQVTIATFSDEDEGPA